MLETIPSNPILQACRPANITTSFSARGTAVLGLSSGRGRKCSAHRLHECSPSSMLVRKDPETAPLCPQCGDAMRLARKLPPVRPLSGLVVHLCGRCGYVGTADREPEPPPPKWLRPQRGTRYSLFRAGSANSNDFKTSRYDGG
jgi:hypothetical protein